MIDILPNFSARIDDYSKKFGANFVVALSGGGDSMALLALCRFVQIAKAKIGEQVNFTACIIDHAIAKNSSEVANTAKARAEAIGINASVLRVAKPITKAIQKVARNSRHELLAKFAQEIDAKTILLAHNQDDQIETIIFRMLRGTGLDGLCAMREVQTSFSDSQIILARPLLLASRSNLRDFLSAKNLEYFDDPANQNQDFARVKIRKSLLELSQIGFVKDNLLAVATKALELREISETRVCSFLMKHLEIGEMAIYLDYEKFEKSFAHEKGRILQAIIAALNPKNYQINDAKINRIIAGFKDDKFKGATLSGIKINKGAKIIFKLAPPRKNSQIIEFPTNQEFLKRVKVQLNQMVTSA